MKIKNINNINIYERDGVFGDEDRFIINSDRFTKIMKLAKSLDKQPINILDIGCGTGYLSNEIKQIYPHATIYSIDISHKALALGRKKYKKIKFLYADAENKLKFKSNFFDLVFSGEHIEHLKDPDTYLSEINRIMKKKGVLIMTTPNLAYWLNRILILLGKQPFYLEPSLIKTLPIIQIGNKTFPNDLNALPSGHLRLYTLNMLKKLLSYYEFSIIENTGYYFFTSIPLKFIDKLLSYSPSLAFGIVIKVLKN